jgi:hypothetical protein
MVPRRAVLASAAVLSASLGGCLSQVGLARTGYLQFKFVEVEWRHGGSRYRDQILYASYDGEDRPWCRVAEEYRELAASVDDVRVTDDLLDRLESRFDDVRYVLGFCWADGECRNPTATRAEFNRVQFGDRAEFAVDQPGLHVVDVFEDANASIDDWAAVNTIDFSALHADHGVPVDYSPSPYPPSTGRAAPRTVRRRDRGAPRPDPRVRWASRRGWIGVARWRRMAVYPFSSPCRVATHAPGDR